MTKALATASLAALVLAGCAPQPGDLGASSHGSVIYQQEVRSGARARMGDYRTYRTDAACSTASLPQIDVLSGPAHGRVAFGVGPARFVANKPARHRCDRGAGTAAIVYYVANGGYRGLDALSYRVRYRDGETEIVRKRLIVR